jgi:sRNA-binding protein
MNNRKVTAEMRHEAFEFLRQRYPNAFRLADIQPFKVGITHELMVELEDILPKVGINRRAIYAALEYYIHSDEYRRAKYHKGTVRIGLDGNPEGEVTEEHIQIAKAKHVARKRRRRQRKAKQKALERQRLEKQQRLAEMEARKAAKEARKQEAIRQREEAAKRKEQQLKEGTYKSRKERRQEDLEKRRQARQRKAPAKETPAPKKVTPAPKVEAKVAAAKPKPTITVKPKRVLTLKKDDGKDK